MPARAVHQNQFRLAVLLDVKARQLGIGVQFFDFKMNDVLDAGKKVKRIFASQKELGVTVGKAPEQITAERLEQAGA